MTQKFTGKCPVCGRRTDITDYPDMTEYHHEDCEWGIEPDDRDPGVLVAKPGAIPVSACTGLQGETDV